MRLIDADKLKAHYSWWNNEEKDVFDSIVDLQPTVESRPQGRWEVTSTFPRRWKCSECGNEVYADSREDFPNYCGVCGADMRCEE